MSDEKCANGECRISETGKCVEGLAKEECPHFGRARGETIAAARTYVPLPLGTALDLKATSNFMRGRRSVIVGLIGPPDSGKTSLLASIHGLLQEVRLTPLRFAGSQTLHSFEKICHSASARSGRRTPESIRTPRGATHFFELSLLDGQSSTRMTILIADRAGEDFLELTHDVALAESLSEFGRADILTLLVDGKRLLDSAERHNVRSDCELIIRAFRDGSLLSGNQRLVIATTKLDEIESSPQKERALRDVASLTSSLSSEFGPEFSDIAAVQVAASPANGSLPRGYGVPQLVEHWLKSRPIEKIVTPQEPTPVRAFARFVRTRL